VPSNNSKNIDKSGIDIVLRKDNAMACAYGRIDIDSSPAIRDRLLTLFEAPHSNIVSIDLSAVTHIDSSGVATLIEALKIARAHRIELRLEGLQGSLLRLFEFTGVLSLFKGSTRG
jgi:anti-sigma B factor antagonist